MAKDGRLKNTENIKIYYKKHRKSNTTLNMGLNRNK